jgi:carnitine O-palmitoyltransferase 2
MGSIEYVLNDGVDEEPNPLGVMTTQERDKWATVREHLVTTSVRNQKSLDEIDTALFVLCLDDVELGTDPVGITQSFLHSDGTNR